MKNTNCNVLSATDSASHNGIQIDASQIVSVSFHAIFGDSSAGGTLSIEASNDECDVSYNPTAFTVTNWVAIPNATVTVTAGAPVLITIAHTSYRWMRAVYTSSSGGTTTINVNMFAVCL